MAYPRVLQIVTICSAPCDGSYAFSGQQSRFLLSNRLTLATNS